jgi:hypothetical protein
MRRSVVLIAWWFSCFQFRFRISLPCLTLSTFVLVVGLASRRVYLFVSRSFPVLRFRRCSFAYHSLKLVPMVG